MLSAVILGVVAAAGLLAAETNVSDEGLLFSEIVPVVIGTLTQTEASKSPTSVTTIDRQEIEITPARNIYDLLNVYVPGFEAMRQFD